jgi:ABC-type phosphate transport system substrate-binding protein
MRIMILTLSLVAGLIATTRTARAQEFVVVVNEANPNRTISSAELGRVFQKQAARWPNGLAAEPVDLAEGSALRERFSRGVFSRSTAQIKAWWQAQIFSGRAIPPVELASESQVLEYVQTHGGAIGYVSAAATIPAGVRRLPVTR